MKPKIREALHVVKDIGMTVVPAPLTPLYQTLIHHLLHQMLAAAPVTLTQVQVIMPSSPSAISKEDTVQVACSKHLANASMFHAILVPRALTCSNVPLSTVQSRHFAPAARLLETLYTLHFMSKIYCRTLPAGVCREFIFILLRFRVRLKLQ